MSMIYPGRIRIISYNVHDVDIMITSMGEDDMYGNASAEDFTHPWPRSRGSRLIT
jgi:hypothetical protein